MSPSRSGPLPHYQKPPVVEVVCGLTFSTPKGFNVPYYGAFWKEIQNEYPRQTTQPFLMRRIENVESSGSSQEKQEIPLSPRVWFLSGDERQLIQLQLDSFLYNWKLVETDDEYPRFESVWSEFTRMLERFDQFLESEDIPRPAATQYELTYVNLIPQQGVCAHLGEIGNLLPDNRWRDASDRFLPHPDGWNLRLAFKLPNKLGRLHVHAQDAMRLSDGKKIIRMDLTARGIGIDPSRGKMREWFDVGHEWIVRGFTDLTTESVQTSVWRRSQ